jgi:hypothetical protein
MLYRILYRHRRTRKAPSFNWPVSSCKPRRCKVAEPRQRRDVAPSEGNYESYTEDLKRRKGPDADQPHRVQYKKLVRA